MAPTTTLRRLARKPAKRFRRAFVPEYEDLLAEVRGLRERLDGLQDLPAEVRGLRERLDGLQDLPAEVRGLRERLDGLQDLPAELRGLRERLDGLQDRVHLVEDGLHEARRLNLRIAQLTDVVTELVLPLHDRDIDPSVFERLPDDTK